MNPQVLLLAEKIWNYHQMKQSLVKADAILVLCSHDERVAERAAELFLKGWAPLLIFSGGAGKITSQLWTEPEAERFAKIAQELGVPRQQILVEPASTNTGENISFTRKLLEEKNLALHSFIVVQKPYMERRSYATFKKVWPEKQIIVTSPQVTFSEYLAKYVHDALSADDVISIMVGDLQRIKLYPDLGFQIAQEIPQDVWSAFEELSTSGYNRHLIKSSV
jgi:uncharacterized SAM-binding protein YcdF (DUF218 family)